LIALVGKGMPFFTMGRFLNSQYDEQR
jgi:hypothetical protein